MTNGRAGRSLIEHKLVEAAPGDSDALRPTKLGRATVAAGLSPEEGVQVFEALLHAGRVGIKATPNADFQLVFLAAPLKTGMLLVSESWAPG